MAIVCMVNHTAVRVQDTSYDNSSIVNSTTTFSSISINGSYQDLGCVLQKAGGKHVKVSDVFNNICHLHNHPNQ